MGRFDCILYFFRRFQKSQTSLWLFALRIVSAKMNKAVISLLFSALCFCRTCYSCVTCRLASIQTQVNICNFSYTSAKRTCQPNKTKSFCCSRAAKLVMVAWIAWLPDWCINFASRISRHCLQMFSGKWIRTEQMALMPFINSRRIRPKLASQYQRILENT